jgi:hypothetical protein
MIIAIADWLSHWLQKGRKVAPAISLNLFM